MRLARLGIYADLETVERRRQFALDSFELYAMEILQQAGMPFEVFHDRERISLACFDILIPLIEQDSESFAERCRFFAEEGGTVISFGGLERLADSLGCVPVQYSGAGYARLDGADGLAFSKDEALRGLRFLWSSPWKISDPRAVSDTCGGLHIPFPDLPAMAPARIGFTLGKGYMERWGVCPIRSIVGFQQGTKPVIKDGCRAPDGTADIQEEILKAEDGMEMNWEWDRVETASGLPYFAFPYADYWREIFVHALLRVAVERKMTLPFKGCWPDGVDCVAVISHDSDNNLDSSAYETLEALKEAGIRSTWCMIEPGFSEAVYEKVRQDGHELAFHFNALDEDGGRWTKEEFARQSDWAQQATGMDNVVSNKNHYTRFEGWGELFRWCEQFGIGMDQTRGPSKRGNTGFLFGTCHPYFPIGNWEDSNKVYDVVELGFLAQDMYYRLNEEDTSMIEPLLEKVKSVSGVAHFLFHQYLMERSPEVKRAFFYTVQAARDHGFQFWTAREVNEWVRYRRGISLPFFIDSGETTARHANLERPLVCWIPVVEPEEAEDGETTAMQYGIKCRKKILI